MQRNIGYDFKKNKSKILRLKESKLKQLYEACIRTKNYGDISKINPNKLPDFDLFNFSFPCTNISVAGKREGMKDQQGNMTSSGLYIYGINIIKIKKPKYIMIENVKNLIGKKFINNFYNIINELNEIGYNCYYPKNSKEKPTCLNAKDYGVPQNRERIYVICIRKDIDTYDFKFPIGKDYGIRLKDILEDIVDEKYYLSEELQKRFKFNSNKDISHNELNVIESSASDYKQPKQILETNNLNQIGELDLKGYNDFSKRVYSINGVGRTLMGSGGNLNDKAGQYLINHKIRRPTPLECLRLMGFDDEDYWQIKKMNISDSQIYKMAGNSIVVNVLMAIFKNLLIHIK